MRDLNERVLASWIRLSLAINNGRLVSDLTFNESVILRLIKFNEQATASWLCEKTGILKSQMNLLLNRMADKKLIIKERSVNDKRKVYIKADPNCDVFEKQHEKIIAITDQITAKLGNEKCEEVIKLFDLIANAAKEERI